ncbi:archaemetzincin-2-like [Styela clava]|uniref:archaemetzincin-2-like n=1 Tax=Styela clava TaxID=7725 RepID=UPI00193AD043|nr:archaemetzincin-2-like [Styela clava]
MPTKSMTLSQRKRALIGSSNFARAMYREQYSSGIRKLMSISYKTPSSAFFKEITNSDPSDWLLHHKEEGQTFEQYFKSCLTGVNFNSGGCESLKEKDCKTTISILPLGPFPSCNETKCDNSETYGENNQSKTNSTYPNYLLFWLKSYCETFFHTAKVEMLSPVTLKEVACDYRVNEFTGRFQLNASQILDYLRRTKTPCQQCLVAVTMIDLFPKPSWNFVFGLASTIRGSVGGVGIFSFCRYNNDFYETWSLREDVVRKYPDGSLDYSALSNEQMEKQFPRINGILLLRACKVMTHEVCHMFGLKHCIYMQCLMNGTNHLQESDRRPPQLCPVCLRKLQAALNFDVLERYKALLKWTSSIYRKDVSDTYDKKQPTHRPSSTKRKERASASPKKIKRKGSASSQRSFKAPSRAITKHRTTDCVDSVSDMVSQIPCPPLKEFGNYKLWLREVIEFILSNGKPTFLSCHEDETPQIVDLV